MSEASTVRDRVYGEPIELRGRHIYFTSWKYVRPGQFTWKTQNAPEPTEAEKLLGWLAKMQTDGDRPADFELHDMPRGIRLVAQKAKKVPLAPGSRAPQVYDEGRYKVWHTMAGASNPDMLGGHNHYVCYTESSDGVHWDKPELGIHEHEGSRANNIVWRGDLNGSLRGFHGGSVFVDPSSTDERYKMFYLGLITDEEWDRFAARYPGELDTMARRCDIGGQRCVSALFGAVSPDGLHWTDRDEPLAIQHADTLNTCYYDLDLEKYVAYVRAWQVVPKALSPAEPYPDTWMSVGRRSIGRSFSDDFRHFTKAELVVTPGADMPPCHVWYTNCKTTLPDAPDNHVMFPWLWEVDIDGGDVHLFSSADSLTWSRVPGGPVVETGAPGEPDGLYLSCSPHLLEYPDDTWRLPFGGTPIPHKYPGRNAAKRTGLFPGVKGVAGLATWPKGRLVAMECRDDGEFATVALMPPGNGIRLNATVQPTGYIKVGVAVLQEGDVPGRTFEDADRFVGDDFGFPVTWNGEADLRNGGKPIILRFRLRHAKLFAIEFVP